MAKKKAVEQKPRSRRGHPARTGAQQQIRELMFDVFDLCDKTGLWSELYGALDDEALGRGLPTIKALFGLVPSCNRHEL